MTLPDFMAYKDKFTQSAFVEKISHVAKRAGAKICSPHSLLYIRERQGGAERQGDDYRSPGLPHQSAGCHPRCHSYRRLGRQPCCTCSSCSRRFGAMFQKMPSRKPTASFRNGLMRMSCLRWQMTSSRRNLKIHRYK